MSPSMPLKLLAPVLALVALAPTPAAAGGCGDHECYEKVRTPDVYATVARPVVVEPARTEVYRTPGVYGAVAREVEVAPARAWTSYTPAVYGTVVRDVVVSPGGYRWQRSVDWHGRERLCKVQVPAVTRRVAQRVLVRAPERVTHVEPAVTRTVYRNVVLQEPRFEKVYRPALIGYEHRDVLVRRGGYHWARSW